MRLDEVVKEVLKKYKEAMISSGKPPKIVIYMDEEYYCACKAEVSAKGRVESHFLYEFYRFDTIRGYPVWRVIPTCTDKGISHHPPFRVVELSKVGGR